MMSAPPKSVTRVHVAPATTAEDWIHVRRLMQEHIDWLAAVLDLDVRANQHDSNEELDSIASFYHPPAGQCLLGYVDDIPCGTTGVHLMDADTAEIRRVWITPSARGQHLAPLLLQQGIETARALGARRIWLETALGAMDKAISIYRRAGFQPIPHYSSLHDVVPGLVSLGLELYE